MKKTDFKDELELFRQEENRVRRGFLERQRKEKEFKKKQLLKYGIFYSSLSTLLVAPTLMITTDMSNLSAVTYSVISCNLIGLALANVRYGIDALRKGDDLAKENFALSLVIFSGACLLAGMSNDVLSRTVFKNEPYVIQRQEKKLLKEVKALSSELDSFISKLPPEKQAEFKAKISSFNRLEKKIVVGKHKMSSTILPSQKQNTK